jgi:hypothetical protein
MVASHSPNFIELSILLHCNKHYKKYSLSKQGNWLTLNSKTSGKGKCNPAKFTDRKIVAMFFAPGCFMQVSGTGRGLL